MIIAPIPNKTVANQIGKPIKGISLMSVSMAKPRANAPTRTPLVLAISESGTLWDRTLWFNQEWQRSSLRV